MRGGVECAHRQDEQSHGWLPPCSSSYKEEQSFNDVKNSSGILMKVATQWPALDPYFVFRTGFMRSLIHLFINDFFIVGSGGE